MGQSRLMRVYDEALAEGGLIGGQVLLAPLDFMVRQQYLHARSTLTRLLELGVVPVVNENDAIADDEIRFGDNDRLAALVAHLVGADLLVLLTDQPASPPTPASTPRRRSSRRSSRSTTRSRPWPAGGQERGSGGMASKLAAAKIAAWSGVRAVIAQAARHDVLAEAVDGEPASAPWSPPGAGGCRPASCGSRSRWARRAPSSSTRAPSGRCRAGRVAAAGRGHGVKGGFEADEAVEVAGPDGAVFAKGLCRLDAAGLREVAGRRTSSCPRASPTRSSTATTSWWSQELWVARPPPPVVLKLVGGDLEAVRAFQAVAAPAGRRSPARWRPCGQGGRGGPWPPGWWRSR